MGQEKRKVRVAKKRGSEEQEKFAQFDRRFTQLEQENNWADAQQVVSKINGYTVSLPTQLEKIRKEGYPFEGEFEATVTDFAKEWIHLRPKVETFIASLQDEINRKLERLESTFDRAEKMGSSGLATLENEFTQVETRMKEAAGQVGEMYATMHKGLGHISWRVSKISEILEKVNDGILNLREGEGVIAAVEAEWLSDGDEGPDGVLFLTDQRLLFEQNEKVSKKKFLGLFTTESEKLHKALLDVPSHGIEGVEHSEEGGFLGMGKADMLDLTFTADAPVARARFHLKGQDSADWAKSIRQVQSGEIQKSRATGYETTTYVQKIFPEKCSNCYGTVPIQPLGVSMIECEFCGAAIYAQDEENDASN